MFMLPYTIRVVDPASRLAIAVESAVTEEALVVVGLKKYEDGCALPAVFVQ